MVTFKVMMMKVMGCMVRKKRRGGGVGGGAL